MKTNSGKIIIAVLLFITFNLWILSKQDPLSGLTGQPLLFLSQILALWGIVLMSVSLVLSTRVNLVEKAFGGLDKVYSIHHLVGATAFLFLINHPLLLAINSLPSIKVALLYLIPGVDISYNLGIIGIYTMIFSFFFIAVIKLPYHIWIWTHKSLGGAFLFGSLHAVLIGSDIGNFFPLKLWILFFIIAGLMSVTYTAVFYKKFGPRFVYRVKEISRVLDIANILLEPVAKPLNFKPGQFAFISFVNSKVSKEHHPFSFSYSPANSDLRFSAKILGDYTMNLRNAQKDDIVAVYGPYGGFSEPYLNSKNTKQIWVAGGIGITPFLSMLSYEVENPSEREFHLFYAFSNPDDGVFSDEVTSQADKLNNFRVNLWCSAEKGRLNAEKIAQNIYDDLHVYTFLLCGPVPMMESLRDQLISMGVSEKNVYYEKFEMI